MVADNVAKRTGYLLDIPKIDTTLIADTKSDAFGGLSKKAINSPEIQSGGKEFGKYLIDYLDKEIPGSRAKGRELKTAIEAMDILNRQNNVGRGSQIVSLFKAPIAGAVAGAGMQSYHDGGITPKSVATGIGAGLLMSAVNSPTTARIASRAATSQVPRVITQGVYNAANTLDSKPIGTPSSMETMDTSVPYTPPASTHNKPIGLFSSPVSTSSQATGKKIIFKAPKATKTNYGSLTGY